MLDQNAWVRSTNSLFRSSVQIDQTQLMFLILEYSMPSQDYPFTIVSDMSDNGIVVILDSRIVNKAYGAKFLAAVPKCKAKIVAARESLQGPQI